MSDDCRFQSAFATAEEFSSIEVFAAASTEVYSGAHRLDGEYYGDDGYRAKHSLERSGFPRGQLQDTSAVFQPGLCGPNSESQAHRGTSQRSPRSRGGRTYVDDKETGVLFLTTADMLQARFDSPRYISRVLSSSVLRIQPGCILISGSGTIGNTVLATDDFSDAYVSHDAFRVTPNDHSDLGMLYCFFQSNAGQFLLTRNKSGGVVEHIYEHDLNTLVIPLLPRAFRKELTRLIDESCHLRVNANKLIDEAIADVQHQCYLPDLSHFMSGRTPDAEPLTFIHSAKARLFPEDAQFGERRLDATYHEPAAVALAKYILSHDRGCQLGQVLTAVRNSTLRKRNYVDDPELGVALIGGKQLMQWRPQGLKYLSSSLTRNLEKETVESGWTIVSCGGTLGRCQYIHRNFEGWAMSQDVMRIIPDKDKIAPGFIYAFLSSAYGQTQIHCRGYGSVIPRLRDFQFNTIAIPVPDDRGESIHEKIVAAYEARGEAHDREDEAFRLFDSAIERGRAYTEAEWGSEY
ncbi:restriction endonuclease subunit S [Aeoliella sp. ICT_H6.2]|uniref:Restriction endonuclease subunit S n=1 Tax=Aeoliella straminimaris TaxID=2954799 RepID=A0A9X2JEI2_9BACT|nr:restriction endonuclease subunit S [Aeoliella straminimaris]MCO6042671.1 restriction endonuclease subunit S [Aeoliella straminimaris]